MGHDLELAIAFSKTSFTMSSVIESVILYSWISAQPATKVIDMPYSINLNTPYGSDEDINMLYLGRRFDTLYPTGGYGVSGGLPEQSTFKNN
nr:hypothetical protein [Tanacetum cinerariifolium]